MWYPHYHIRFVEDSGHGSWLVEVQGTTPPAGPVVEIEAGDTPLTWMGDGNAGATEVILGATGTLEVSITEETLPVLTIGKLLPDGALSRRVVVTREGMTVCTGFIQPQTFNQEWDAPPLNVSLSLMDTVAALKYVYMEQDETADNILDMLFSAYKKVGGEKGRSAFLRSNVKAYNGRADIETPDTDWGTGQLYPEFWTSDEDKKVSYDEVLSILLSPHARLMQTGETWFVGRDDITTTQLYGPADTDDGQLTPDAAGIPITDIGHAVAGSNNNQAQLPPPSKVTANYSPDEGTINLSGDTIFRLSADMIVSDAVTSVVDVLSGSSQGSTLRYLFLKDVKGNFRRTSATYHYTLDWTGSGWERVWRTDENFAPGWAQVLLNDVSHLLDPNFTVEKELVFCASRECVERTATFIHNKWSEDYFAIQTPVYVQPGTNMLHLKTESYAMNFGEKAHATCGIFWGKRPGELTKVYGSRFGTVVREWYDYNPDGPYAFNYPTTNGELDFHLPEGETTGYITIMVTGNPDDYLAFGARSSVPFTEITLSYAPENRNPRKPMQWNKEAVNIRKETLAGGVDDITMNFQTLAGVEPDASTLFAPRRGFDDSIHYVNTPREMIDIEAVQVTEDGGIPGITRFSLFEFDGKVYFPAAVGMNARDNTVSLKLIRTIQ